MHWKWKYLIQQQHQPKSFASVKRSITNISKQILTWRYAPSTDAILVDSGNSESVPISRMQVFLDFDLSHVLSLTTGALYDGERFGVVCRRKIETKIIPYFNVLQKKWKRNSNVWLTLGDEFPASLVWYLSFYNEVGDPTAMFRSREEGQKDGVLGRWPVHPHYTGGLSGGSWDKTKKVINVCYPGSSSY